jgi:hypothetical protein
LYWLFSAVAVFAPKTKLQIATNKSFLAQILAAAVIMTEGTFHGYRGHSTAT